ncbi:MAG: sugar ABC transporter ATP-binding protein [Roseitalea sp.]|jgi:simple sugar transport system ATP-binding protein|nr:sugar ABC transporter ATP-binding protein [Roseitalea sp.]MBO6722663.1 sugar ABC transporter ATP-binding protein [Roseitalea sp.]MBO6741553.1 sugar ABC transporter ATP-binding protein [Roseitalea sp.]
MTAPALKARGIVKRYGHIEALRGVDFQVDHGEVVALIGDNGAGKSTLSKILVGAIEPTEGTIEFEGGPVVFKGPADARRHGLEIVYQDLALAPHLEPAENFYLGREIYRGGALGRWLGLLDRATMRRRAIEAMRTLNVNLKDERGRISELSGGQQQGVAVARAAFWASSVLFLDEPTAALGVRQRSGVHDMIKKVQQNGLGIVLISHDLPEVMDVADRIHVLRRGETAKIYERGETDTMGLVAAITGAH